jgi:hypothetical protein
LTEAGIVYDREAGFVIQEANVRDHSGIIQCKASREEDNGTSETGRCSRLERFYI